MQIVEHGHGTPLVLVTGSQGRWEFGRPAVEALARHFRVITFSLCDEPCAGFPFDRERAAESYVSQIDAALDRTGVARAVVCGVSFGGLLALHFAATRPDRVQSLVLVSTPGPGWHLRPKHEVYVRMPWLFGPLFLVESGMRLSEEIRVALPDPRARRRFKRWGLRTLVSARPSLSRIATRARLIAGFDREQDCARVAAPTLIVTGEPGLDYVVPVNGTSEYVQHINGARHVILEGSGHIGSSTKPDRFAAIVHEFVHGHRHAAA
jgi:pimeloyl-ACP methyl ester carboxylesterase